MLRRRVCSAAAEEIEEVTAELLPNGEVDERPENCIVEFTIRVVVRLVVVGGFDWNCCAAAEDGGCGTHGGQVILVWFGGE